MRAGTPARIYHAGAASTLEPPPPAPDFRPSADLQVPAPDQLGVMYYKKFLDLEECHTNHWTCTNHWDGMWCRKQSDRSCDTKRWDSWYKGGDSTDLDKYLRRPSIVCYMRACARVGKHCVTARAITTYFLPHLLQMTSTCGTRAHARAGRVSGGFFPDRLAVGRRPDRACRLSSLSS